jgi:hypothetical protein
MFDAIVANVLCNLFGFLGWIRSLLLLPCTRAPIASAYIRAAKIDLS